MKVLSSLDWHDEDVGPSIPAAYRRSYAEQNAMVSREYWQEFKRSIYFLPACVGTVALIFGFMLGIVLF
ncbi:hypothetical protein [Paracoccus saliphilus]|nr:hypothetical protein [Paracoccus saliphilus]WCR05652.1 hypothetical protein JHX88_21480 [Paracoccus saliphilus]